MTQLKSTSAKDIFLGDIQDPAVQEAFQLLLRNVRELAKQTSITVNENEALLPVVLAYTAPTLLNGWIDFGVSWNGAGYAIDKFNVVHLRGLVTNGTVGLPMFNLPVGFRPPKQAMFSVVANNAFGRIDVGPTGDVTLQIGSNVFTSLEGITYSI